MRRYFRRIAQWLVRLLLRVGLLPASTKADSDTMGEYKRLMAEKDDPRPGLVLPDPNAPHADLIRRVRLYAQNGAKALGPLLDEPWTVPSFADARQRARGAAVQASDTEAGDLLLMIDKDVEAWVAIHAAYNSPWTVVDGEVYEYESERKRRVVQ